MKKNRFLKIAVLIVSSAIVLQTGIMAYSIALEKDNEEKVNQTEKNPNKQVEREKNKPVQYEVSRAYSSDEIETIKKIPKIQVDISNVIISKEIEEKIISLDLENSERNINNFKNILAEFDVPFEYRQEIERLIIDGYDIPDIFTAYNFLYENYGLISELKILLEKVNKEKEWSHVFYEYEQNKKEFKLTDFERNYLENLINTTRITIEDITIADIISQKGLISFNELINLRKQDKTWKEINTSLGVVNTAQQLPKLALTSSMVARYKKSSGLSENEVINALLIAQMIGKEEDEIIKKVKEGKKKEEIYTDLYKEKYR